MSAAAQGHCCLNRQPQGNQHRFQMPPHYWQKVTSRVPRTAPIL